MRDVPTLTSTITSTGTSTSTITITIDHLSTKQVVQIAPSFFNLVDLAPYPRITAWLDRMAAQPYHEEVRT